MKVGVTGHRPSKLRWGYDYNHPYWLAVKKLVKQFLLYVKCSDLYTGMALGFDTVCALAVLELRQEGYAINLHCAIPCQGHSSKWPDISVRLYDKILHEAQEVIIVTDAPYKPYLMQKRNEYIVDRVEKMLALFDGSDGGTGNCVKYARKVDKPVFEIDPSDVVKCVNDGTDILDYFGIGGA